MEEKKGKYTTAQKEAMRNAVLEKDAKMQETVKAL